MTSHTKEADRVLTLLKEGKQKLDNKLFLAMHEVLHMDLRIQKLEATEDELCMELNEANVHIHELEEQLWEARAISPPRKTTGLFCTECLREVLERDFDLTGGMCLGCYAKGK